MEEHAEEPKQVAPPSRRLRTAVGHKPAVAGEEEVHRPLLEQIRDDVDERVEAP